MSRPHRLLVVASALSLTGGGSWSAAQAAGAPIGVSASHVEVTCTRQYRDPATLPEPPKASVHAYLLLRTPEAAGMIGIDYVHKNARVVLGDEEVEFSGFSSGFKPGEVPNLSPSLFGDTATQICASTASDPRVVVDELLFPAYVAHHDKVPLVTLSDVVGPDAKAVSLPEHLASIGATIADVTETGFVIQFQAPGDVFELEVHGADGKKVKDKLDVQDGWRLYQATTDEKRADFEQKVTRVTVDASDPSLQLVYSFKEGFQQLPVHVDVPLIASNPRLPDLEASGSIVSVQRSCVVDTHGKRSQQHLDSKTTLTVALPLPSKQARPIGWQNLQLSKGKLSDKTTLQLAEGGRTRGEIPGERPGLESRNLRARVHGDEVLLDIPILPSCSPLAIAKLAGTVDLRIAEKSEEFRIDLGGDKQIWTDPKRGAFHLELEQRRSTNLEVDFVGTPERLDFQVVDKDGAVVETSYTSGNDQRLGGSVSYNFKEALPEGAQLVVTVHRKVSTVTVPFAAQDVPLP